MSIPSPAANAQPGGSLYESRIKIYPRSVTGVFARWRWVMVWVTQLFFYGMPWLQWNGRQALLFDLEQRRFYVLGLVLQPQDFIYLAALLFIAALALFFFTAIAGRLWCGYSCPQTVYTEMFLWLERVTEGDRSARMRLDAQPWTPAKLARKGSKQVLWIALALLTGFTFVGYFTPIRELPAALMVPAESPWLWFWVSFYGFATYGNAGFMREQVCKYMCPYARFQSALIDMDSLVIAYDTARGEPRGARSKKVDPASKGLGACVDCTLCVQVCPTGIDIRNGLQNECIGCAACIDVCNDVMAKMDYPKGLIRYSTENGVANGWTRKQMFKRALRPRVLIYGALLTGAGVAFAVSVALRSPFQFEVIRDRAMLARVVDDGVVENVYRIRVMNRTEAPQTYRLAVGGIDGLSLQARETTVPPAGIESVVASVRLPAEPAQALGGRTVPIEFELAPLAQGAGPPAAALRQASTFHVPR